MLKLIYNQRTKTTFQYIIITVFGLCYFSIPTFSFLSSFYKLTWIFSILLFALMVLYMALYNEVKIDYINCSLFLFIISATIGTMLTGFKEFSFTPILNTISIIVIYTFCAANRSLIKKMMFSLHVGLILFAFIFAFRYRYELIHMQFSRLGSLFGDINDISIVLSIGFALSFYKCFYDKKFILKILYSLASILFLALSFSSGSKISILLSAVSFATVITMYFGKKKWYITTSILVIVTILFFVLINMPFLSTLKKRLISMISTLLEGSNSSDGSTITRFNMFLDGVSLFLRRPLLGFGTSGFHAFSSFHNGWSHNHYSDSLCNYGIIGTILYHVPLIICFKTMKSKGVQNKYLIVLLVLFITSTISIALFKEKFVTYLIGVIYSEANAPVIKCLKVKIIKENIHYSEVSI